LHVAPLALASCLLNSRIIDKAAIRILIRISVSFEKGKVLFPFSFFLLPFNFWPAF